MQTVCRRKSFTVLPALSSIGLVMLAAAGACQVDSEVDPEVDPEVATAGQAIVTTTPFISEEDGQADNGGAMCPDGQVAMGYECTGGWCDNIRLLCDSFPGTLGALQPWTPFFSEENPGHACSGLDEWIVGIQCRGWWCDDIRFRCRKATRADVRTVERTSCFGTTTVSEETPPMSLEGTGRFLVGLACSGSYCDNLSGTGCVPAPQCEASLGCGFNAAAPCQCDSACTSFGDCCSNKIAECGL